MHTVVTIEWPKPVNTASCARPRSSVTRERNGGSLSERADPIRPGLLSRVRNFASVGAKVGVCLSVLPIAFSLLTRGQVMEQLGISLSSLCASYVIGGAAVGAATGVFQPLLTTRVRVGAIGALLGCAFMFGLDAVKHQALQWSRGDVFLDLLIGMATGIPIALNILKDEKQRSGDVHRVKHHPNAGMD